MLITKDKLSLAKYADKNSDKSIGNLYLDGNKATASNGHYLFQIEDTPDHDLDFPSVGVTLSSPDKVLVRPSTADKVLKNLPKKSPHIPIILNAAFGIEKDKIQFGCTDLETTTTVKQRIESGIYPDTEAAFPKKEPDHTLLIDSEYLEKALKAIREFNKDTAIKISIYKQEEEAPIILEGKKDDATITALIMPLNAE